MVEVATVEVATVEAATVEVEVEVEETLAMPLGRGKCASRFSLWDKSIQLLLYI